MFPIFKSERTIIRTYKPTDSYNIWRVISRREIYDTTYAIPHPYPIERIGWWISFIKNSAKNGTSYEFGIFHNKTGEYIGNVGIINISKQNSCGDISYFINPDYWNMGYATEAAGIMLDYGFNRLNLNRIGGRCMSKNPASASVMKKLGMKHEGRGRSEIYKDGIFLDVEHFSILRSEYIIK